MNIKWIPNECPKSRLIITQYLIKVRGPLVYWSDDQYAAVCWPFCPNFKTPLGPLKTGVRGRWTYHLRKVLLPDTHMPWTLLLALSWQTLGSRAFVLSFRVFTPPWRDFLSTSASESVVWLRSCPFVADLERPSPEWADQADKQGRMLR